MKCVTQNSLYLIIRAINSLFRYTFENVRSSSVSSPGSIRSSSNPGRSLARSFPLSSTTIFKHVGVQDLGVGGDIYVTASEKNEIENVSILSFVFKILTRLMRPQPIIFKIFKITIEIQNAYQAHKTPTDYPRDPFERLRHNVAKNALPET